MNLMTNKKKLICSLLGISILFAGCNKHGQDVPVKVKPKGVIEVELQMGPKAGFVYFSFIDKKQVEIKQGSEASMNWDIAFYDINGKTNGGQSGIGKAAVYRTLYNNFQAVKTVSPFLESSQESFWQKDIRKSVYSMYNMPPKVVTDNFNPLFTTWYKFEGMSIVVGKEVYIVRTAEGDYVKMQFIDWRGSKGKWGNVRFRYEYIGTSGSNAPAEGEIQRDNLKAGTLAARLKEQSAKEFKYLTINGGSLNDDDIETIKKLPSILESLDLSRASLGFDDDSYGFKDCRTIKKLIAPANLKTTGGNWPWFAYMPNLEELVFPGNNLESITETAFTGLEKMNKITLPNSVEVMGEKAFYGAKSLKTLVLPSKIEIVPSECFTFCKGLVAIKMPASVKKFYSSALYYCNDLKEIIFEGKTPPELIHKPYNGIEDLKWEKDGKPYLHVYVPKGCIDSYISVWKLDAEKYKKYFVEF